MRLEQRGTGDAADAIARVGRHWGWVMAFGVLTLLAGVAVVVWPGPTILVLALLFGVQLIVSGIFRFVTALASDDLTGGTRVLLALLGVLSFIVGLYALRHVLLTIVVLALLLGIFWIVNGAIEIFTALAHRGMYGRGWAVFTGILSIVAGLIALVVPGITLLWLAIVLGVWLVVFGIIEITAALRLRRSARQMDSRVAHVA
jgi:uncharacterized membrane protein HdeD (DUF308 family)